MKIAMNGKMKLAGGQFEMHVTKLYWLHNLSGRGDKQETWMLKTMCNERELVKYKQEWRSMPETIVATAQSKIWALPSTHFWVIQIGVRNG